MHKKIAKRTYLRIVAAVILGMIVAVFVILALFTTKELHRGIDLSVRKARLDLSPEETIDSVVYLNGEWECFDGVICKNGEDVSNLGDSDHFVDFPLGTIVQAKKDATYRFYFKLPKDSYKNLFLYIPTFDGKVDIFLNGSLQEKAWDDDIWVSFNTMKTFLSLKDVRPGEWQELIISGQFQEQPVTLYKRPVIIGSEQSIITLQTTDGFNEMFLIGTLLLVMVNGYVFMLFRPNHMLISLITLFDSVIMVRVFFSMNYTISFVRNLFPQLVVSDEFSISASLFFLMIGGIIGCILSGTLFDPEKKVPKWATVPIPFVYLLFAFLFPFNLGFFERYGRAMLIITYILTFIGVFWQFTVCWRSTHKSGYYLFQFIKTSYIGVVVFYDISNFTKFVDFMALFYLYAIFFIMHVVVRLYDNNQTYKDVELLNVSLESTVEERTKELSRANERLEELSIRDPLTRAFNRLYFENQLEKAMAAAAEEQTTVYLCMFDLDFFKKINDTYGHDVGDEQLKLVTTIVSSIVEDHAVFARVGGEEFIILFVGKSEEEMLNIVNQIHRSIEYSSQIDKRRTTASFGIAVLGKGDTAKNLLKNADIALYQAKDKGRNCIVSLIHEDSNILD